MKNPSIISNALTLNNYNFNEERQTNNPIYFYYTENVDNNSGAGEKSKRGKDRSHGRAREKKANAQKKRCFVRRAKGTQSHYHLR